ncbi:Uncharacterised protein [BD1-7 clade bacterium]|uniref:Beta-barrel assembly-enhancing protease n=1 Tax=BD1-7 clade bacterium TaxID=2029982 RepID=A0A5S9MRF5_9GAMM|nr:Uncharacterised protein [BD1-7 clade bacterium]CAA0084508.1 Uncharacterised protein [BD1-7 clade bacterium]
MKKGYWKAASLALAVSLVPMVPEMAQAANKEAQAQYKKKQTKALRAPIFEKLMEAQELQEAGQFDDALKLLDRLKRRTGKRALKPHEMVQLYNFYAYAYLAKEDYLQAIKSFEKLLKEDELTLGLAVATKYTLAQLYFANDDIPAGIDMLNQWFEITDKPTPDAHILLAQGYLQTKNVDKALPELQKGFKLAEQMGKEPKENWYSLLQYAYAEKKQHKKQVDVLEILVNRWPKKNYWLALVGVYGELNDESLQLYALQSAYLQNMLDKESYIVTLAQMLSGDGQPYRAAKVMEKGFEDKLVEPTGKNLERTAEYWRRAQEVERAIPLLAEAAKLSEDGGAAMRLAGLYMNNYQYKDAVSALRLALQKGGLKRPLEARFMLGQAMFHSKNYGGARKEFNSVIADGKKQKDDAKSQRMSKMASQWKKHMQVEIKREQDIKKYLNS